MTPRAKWVNEWWPRFVSKGLCGLCGNTGFVDTRESARSAAGVRCGIKAPCFCPNGRQLARLEWNLKHKGETA